MPRFNLGLFQKNFNSTSRVTGPAINMGCTRGRGSTTRMFNYCNQRSPNPSTCINQFITVNNNESSVTPVPPVPPIPPTPEPSWMSLGLGANNGILCSAVDSNNNLYVGGIFTSVSGVPANNIAKWNGTTWSSLDNGGLGQGVDGPVFAIAIDSNNDVYAGGSFTSAGTLSNYNNIAKWSSSGGYWSTIAGGANNTVRAIAIYQNYIYVGGDFNHVTNISAVPTTKRIAKWDTSISSWSSLNGDIVSGNVYALLTNPNNGELYIGGDFTTFNNGSTNSATKGLLVWYSNNWANISELPFPSSQTIYAMKFNNSGTIYICGLLTDTYGIPNIAVYTPDTNNPLSGIYSPFPTYIGTNGAIRGVDFDSNNNMYIAGLFTYSSNNGSTTILPLNYVAKFNFTTNTWSQLNNGLNNQADTISIDSNDNIFVGGSFTTSNPPNSVSLNRIGKWGI